MPEKAHHSIMSDAEILSAFREFQSRQSQPGTFVPLRNDPHHVGVIDANYVRPAPTEFPKAVYKKSARAKEGYITKVAASQEEQDALQKQGWLISTKDVHALLASLIPKPAEEPTEEEVKPAAKVK